jgi:hypothetical protein
MDEAKGLFLQVADVAEPHGSSTPWKQTTLVRVPVLAFFWGDMFYTHNTQSNCAVTHSLFNYMFQNLFLLSSQG